MTPAGTQLARRRSAVALGGGAVRTGGRRRRVDDHGPEREPAPTLFDGPGGEPTLDNVLAGAWEGLVSRSVVPCPVCGDDMAPVARRDGTLAGGRCGGCGTTLA